MKKDTWAIGLKIKNMDQEHSEIKITAGLQETLNII